MGLDVRLAAARALAAVISRGQSLNQVIPEYAPQIASQDKALLQELCFGCARWQPRLQALANLLVTKPLKNKDADVHALLLIGLYQLIFTRIPDHAAINSCVEASKKTKKPWAARLINGALRNFQRRRPELETQLADVPAYRFSHPQWFIDVISRSWPQEWQALLDANNQHPPMTLRVNQSRISRQVYLDKLMTTGTAATATPFARAGLTLTQPQDPLLLPGFGTGEASVQDEAAQLAAQLLELTPGQRILDACCAPGGKTCHILELEPGVASLTGLDIDAKRLETVQSNLHRLGLSAQLIAADAAEPPTWWDGSPFDRILLDAPCSATGVIRRHPDIKLLRRPSDIAKLAALQLRVLQAVWTTLAPDGLLVYATCSVIPDENELVIAQFLAEAKDAEHQPIPAAWGVNRPFGRQLFPQPGGHDGFYYAVLRKRSS